MGGSVGRRILHGYLPAAGAAQPYLEGHLAVVFPGARGRRGEFRRSVVVPDGPDDGRRLENGVRGFAELQGKRLVVLVENVRDHLHRHLLQGLARRKGQRFRDALVVRFLVGRSIGRRILHGHLPAAGAAQPHVKGHLAVVFPGARGCRGESRRSVVVLDGRSDGKRPDPRVRRFAEFQRKRLVGLVQHIGNHPHPDPRKGLARREDQHSRNALVVGALGSGSVSRRVDHGRLQAAGAGQPHIEDQLAVVFLGARGRGEKPWRRVVIFDGAHRLAGGDRRVLDVPDRDQEGFRASRGAHRP